MRRPKILLFSIQQSYTIDIQYSCFNVYKINMVSQKSFFLLITYATITIVENNPDKSML